MAVEAPNARRRRYVGHPGKVMAAGVVALALLFVSLPVAEAHEIAVAVVVSVGADGYEVDASALVDGLRLAIDQSPDVGHAPGPDAGDHLGGVDIEVIDQGSVSEVVVGASVLSALADGATLVVVVGQAEAIAAVAEVVPVASAFVVAIVTEERDCDFSLPGAVLRRSPTVTADAVGTLSEAFETTYGRELSESAGIGYDAGQLLDVLIAETDGALPDAAALDNVSTVAQARLTFTIFCGADGPPPTSTELPPGASTNSDRFGIGSSVLVGMGVVAVGMFTILVLSRRSKNNK